MPAAPDRRFRPHLDPLEDRLVPAAVNLTAQDQLLLELVNRARLDPLAEAQRLGVGLNDGLPADKISAAPKQALAPNQLLEDLAARHAQDMLDRDYFAHTTPEGQSLKDRLDAAGYPGGAYAENISWGGSTGALNTTQAVYDRHAALFRSAAHRDNLLNPAFGEAGTAVRPGVFTQNGTNYNAAMLVEVFGDRPGVHYLTGVVYRDLDKDQFYSVGEGVGGAVVTAQDVATGAVYTATSGPSGGYALELPAGSYRATIAAGDAAGATVQKLVVIDNQNVKWDYVQPEAAPQAPKNAVVGPIQNPVPASPVPSNPVPVPVTDLPPEPKKVTPAPAPPPVVVPPVTPEVKVQVPPPAPKPVSPPVNPAPSDLDRLFALNPFWGRFFVRFSLGRRR